jgi:hypothetical protein
VRAVERLGGLLSRLGFRPGPVFLAARALILLAFVLSVGGALLLPLTAWLFWLAAGAVLSAWNFCSLAFSLQRFFPGGAAVPVSPGKMLRGQLFHSQLRLFITGILLYASLTIFHANPVALLIGLSSAVMVITVLVARGTPFP